MARIVLVGLDNESGEEFSGKLLQLGHAVESKPYGTGALETAGADVIFEFGDDFRWQRSLERMHEQFPSKPVIVVSRYADEDRWLEALGAGAADFCCTGVDIRNLAWMVDNASGRKALTFAA